MSAQAVLVNASVVVCVDRHDVTPRAEGYSAVGFGDHRAYSESVDGFGEEVCDDASFGFALVDSSELPFVFDFDADAVFESVDEDLIESLWVVPDDLNASGVWVDLNEGSFFERVGNF